MDSVSKCRNVLCLVIGIMTVSVAGCSRDLSPGVDLDHATKVTIEQLKEITKEDNYFYWNGSDKSYHYFQTRKGYYRIASSLKIPDLQNQIDSMVDRGYKPGMKAPVTFQNSEIVGGWGDNRNHF